MSEVPPVWVVATRLLLLELALADLLQRTPTPLKGSRSR